MDRLAAVPAAVLGIALIAARSRFSRIQLEFQRRAFGLRFGDRWQSFNETVALIVGGFFIAMAIVIAIVGLA